jgi:hypothetical protein
MDTNDTSLSETLKLNEMYLSEIKHIKGAVFMKSGIKLVYAPKMVKINNNDYY